jgi:hypothetical protein
MLTISVDNYTIDVKIDDDFDKLTSKYEFYRTLLISLGSISFC